MAKKHYRNYRFWIEKTRGFRTASTAKLFPVHCKMPAIEPGDTIRLAAQDLTKAIQNRNKQAPINLQHKHTEELRQLADIFNQATTSQDEEEPSERVAKPSTSHDPTAQEVLRSQPRIHQRVTRRNTPMPEVIEESFENEVLEEKENIQPNPTPVQRVGRPRRTIAQYKRDKQLLQDATPAPFPMPITQDDEINAVIRELPHMATMRTP
jgi:DNA primase